MVEFDDDIHARVQRDGWKYRPRSAPVTLIELHCTRSGIAGRTPLEEYSATINWSLSPNNKNVRAGDDWASMESFIVGGQGTDVPAWAWRALVELSKRRLVNGEWVPTSDQAELAGILQISREWANKLLAKAKIVLKNL
jgi:hypothetical protein